MQLCHVLINIKENSKQILQYFIMPPYKNSYIIINYCMNVFFSFFLLRLILVCLWSVMSPFTSKLSSVPRNLKTHAHLICGLKKATTTTFEMVCKMKIRFIEAGFVRNLNLNWTILQWKLLANKNEVNQELLLAMNIRITLLLNSFVSTEGDQMERE